MFQRLKPISPLRFAFFSAACGLVAFSSFLLFGALFGDDSDRGQTELACVKAKLEAMWGMPLPADLDVVDLYLSREWHPPIGTQRNLIVPTRSTQQLPSSYESSCLRPF